MSGWWDADLAPDEFRQLGYQAVDIMAEYFASIRYLPAFPGKTSEEVSELEIVGQRFASDFTLFLPAIRRE